MEDNIALATAQHLTLGEVVARSGASTQLLRECESLGLLGDMAHADAGSRQYGARDVSTLRFVRRAQALGFESSEVVELLALWRNGGRTSFDVKRVALARAGDLAQQIEELERMKGLLERLANCCEGSDSPDCPILDELADLNGFAGCEVNGR